MRLKRILAPTPGKVQDGGPERVRRRRAEVHGFAKVDDKPKHDGLNRAQFRAYAKPWRIREVAREWTRRKIADHLAKGGRLETKGRDRDAA